MEWISPNPDSAVVLFLGTGTDDLCARSDLEGHGIQTLHVIEVQKRRWKRTRVSSLHLPGGWVEHAFSVGFFGGLLPAVPFARTSPGPQVWDFALLGIIMRCCRDWPASPCSSWCCMLVVTWLKVTFTSQGGDLNIVSGSLWDNSPWLDDVGGQMKTSKEQTQVQKNLL